MKASGLLSILTFSEKRKDILFFLKSGSKSPSQIRRHLGVKVSSEIAERFNELEDAGLISRGYDGYQLTRIGRSVVANFEPLLDTIKSLEENQEFWNNHDTGAIPADLLDRLRDLKDCKIVKQDSYKLGASHESFLENVANAERFRGVTSVFNPLWVELFTGLSSFGVPIEIITTPAIYEEIQMNYAEELKKGLQNPNAHLYVSSEPLKIGVSTICGKGWTFFSLALHNPFTGDYDNKNDLQGASIEAFKWGEELLERYLENAVEVSREQGVSEFVLPGEKSKVAEFDYV